MYMSIFSALFATPSVPPTEAIQHIARTKSVRLIDVRSPEEFEERHATYAANHPLASLKEHAQSLAAYETLYVMCQSGGRSTVAVSLLRTLGINAINISGGLGAWEEAGLPVTSA